jgi:hypothetical protein
MALSKQMEMFEDGGLKDRRWFEDGLMKYQVSTMYPQVLHEKK